MNVRDLGTKLAAAVVGIVGVGILIDISVGAMITLSVASAVGIVLGDRIRRPN